MSTESSRMLQTLPPDLVTYEHQIAGHGSDQSAKQNPTQDPMRFLYSKDDHCVYKPIQAPPKGDVEVQFYQTVFGDGDAVDQESWRSQQLLTDLQRFLPAFFGVFCHPISGMRYIKLQDLLHGFAKPSIMDIKMGARSFEPTASKDKRSREMGKYLYREQVGFLVTGLRVWREDEGRYERFSKLYGREITSGELNCKILPPLIGSVPANHRLRLLRLMVAELDALLVWFETQRLYHFYASSILLGVESAPDALALSDAGRPQVLVRMVDFTHVLTAEDRLDDGYLVGLRTLVGLCHMHEGLKF